MAQDDIAPSVETPSRAPPDAAVALALSPQPAEEMDADDVADADADDELETIAPSRFRTMVHTYSACFVSVILHAIGILILAMITLTSSMPEIQTILATPFERDEELQEVILEEELDPATEITDALSSSSPAVGAVGGVEGASLSNVKMDNRVVQQFMATEVSIESPSVSMPSSKTLIHAVPEGTLGDPRAIVDDYDQAFDRITREILMLLDKSDVLVIWVFDQSESMKDDQQEIRDRIEKVYQELGLTSALSGERLLTAVTSYGGPFNPKPPFPSPGPIKHTRKPTAELPEIRAAINTVPVDPSGKEFMCEAVGYSLMAHREYAKRYQIMMILVTDESGQPANNLGFLERAIAEARATRCRIYALGRESVFGYPYAHMRWVHPQTGHVHWLPINRGPETGFVEQLQTNGFHRRYDAFPSGFAPYELARMTRETGGICFMLPSLESNLVRGEKRRYELEQMRAYRPDLRARLEVIADRDAYPLRSFLWKVVSDLDPYNKQAAKVIEVRREYPANIVEFVKLARESQRKATVFIQYLGESQRILENAQKYREQETDPRWQANYDLIYAQLVAYQARLYEHGMALEDFIQKPRLAPKPKSPNVRHVEWDMFTTKKTRTEKAKPFIAKSKVLFQEVIYNHPGTPWAARAEWELKRGYGSDFKPDYRSFSRGGGGGGKPVKRIPIPKL